MQSFQETPGYIHKRLKLLEGIVNATGGLIEVKRRLIIGNLLFIL